MRATPVAALILAVGLAGCDVPETALEAGDPYTAPGPAPFLVLEARYVLDEGASGEFNGHHCPDAYLKDGKVHLHDGLKQDLGEGPTLVVEPETTGMWATLGDGGYALRIPAEVTSEAGGDDEPWTAIDWQDGVLVDGRPVALPHSWTVDRDGYTIEATVSAGPVDHEWFSRGMCV